MENYINDEIKNKISYFNYVKSELNKYNTSGSILVNEELKKIDINNINDLYIREICKLVEFLEISENIKIYLYHEWYRHIR